MTSIKQSIKAPLTRSSNTATATHARDRASLLFYEPKFKIS